MVIYCVIKEFLVHNVLVDTGSATDIIFAKAFRQMQEPEDKIHDATCNTPGVTQGVHPGLPLLTYYHMRMDLGKVHQTWNSRS